MKQFVAIFLLLSLAAHSFVSMAPFPPTPSGTILETVPSDTRFVILNKEDVFTNGVDKVVWSVRHVTHTEYKHLAVPMVAFDVTFSTNMTNWTKVDTFWMPMNTNSIQGFYKVEPRIIK